MLNTVSSAYLSFVYFLWRNVCLGPLLIYFWGSFVFLAIELHEFLIYFGYYLTVWYMACKYYLLFHRILFHFVDAFLHSAGDFSSEVVLLVYFSLLLAFHLVSNPKYRCCYSIAQECPALWDRIDCSTPGFPVLHYLPEFDQTHVHWANDTFQPSHLLSSPSPPALNLSQHQGLFRWISSSHQVAKVLEFQLQCQSFQWIFRIDFI